MEEVRQSHTAEAKKKLTAILSADVVGYSRLIGDDEEATIETLTAYRKVFSNCIEQYRGRVVNAPGDSILAEFASVVDAVNSVVENQREHSRANDFGIAQNGREGPTRRGLGVYAAAEGFARRVLSCIPTTKHYDLAVT